MSLKQKLSESDALELECFSRLDSFLSLSGEWEDLLGQSALCHVFQTWQWHLIWCRHLGSAENLRLMALRSPEGKLRGVFPVWRERDGVFRSTGGRDVSDYLDLIAERGWEGAVWKRVLQELWEEEGGGWKLELPFIPHDSPTLRVVPALAGEEGLEVELTRTDSCPVIPLPASWEDYLGSLSSKNRHELRRKLRRAEREAELEFYRCAANERLQEDMELFFQLHGLSSHEKKRFMVQAMRAFFLDVASAFFERGWLDLRFLFVNGEPAAALLSFDYAGRIYLYNSGYDPRFSSLSVGNVLLARLIKEGIERGRAELDLLRGNEPYKYRLGGEDRPLFSLSLRANHRRF